MPSDVPGTEGGKRTGRIHIGLSGYSYKAWQGPERFYSPGLKAAEFLRYYAGRYHAVELDGIWYRLPTESMTSAWVAQTPSHFVFAPKAHRSITHMKRLKLDALPFVQQMLNTLAPLVEEGRLGPILLQLPPNMRRDDDRLGAFLRHLPRTVRWAIEFRHASWHAQEIEALLREYGIAWVAAETDEAPAERRSTATFGYARLRRSVYTDADLEEWSHWFRQAAREQRDTFVFFKHEDEGSPWMWADRLRQLIER